MKKHILAVLLLAAAAFSQDKADLSVIHRIKAEAFQNSKVMDHVFSLTEVHGPRLANTPAYAAACDWAVKRLQEYGLTRVEKEKWSPEGKTWSWTCTRFSAHLLEPQYAPLIGFAVAYSGGTDGPVKGEPMLAVLRNDADLEKHKGKLRGRIVLTEAPRDLTPQMTAPGSRYSDKELAEEEAAPDPGPRMFRRPGPPAPDFQEMMRFRAKINQYLSDEGVKVVLTPGQRGDGGTVFAAGARARGSDVFPPATVALAAEHYNRIARLIQRNVPVTVEIEVRARMADNGGENSFNVVGEIEGGRKKDEVVMVGGHLDSWHGGTGATDNAAGVAIAIEAARILKALDLKMDRTVRLGLWDAEEQGLLGSRAYVKAHFCDPDKMEPKPEHARLAAYYNFDNGTGKIRGIYLQGNDMARPVFEAWLAPFRDLGVTAITNRNTSGTDHLSFDAVGLPGFQFIQDPVEYSSRTHHSNMDVYDRIVPGDLMQASAVIASLVYHTAVRPELLPRKPLPKPGERRAGRT